MKAVYYRNLTTDPENWVEDAVAYKCLYDALGGDIELRELKDFKGHAEGERAFGAVGVRPNQEPKYWHDSAFLENCNRFFEVKSIQDARATVSWLHSQGKDAFLKSTRAKHWLDRVPVGKTIYEVMDGMEYSFDEEGPHLMVQSFEDITFEYRCFIVDGVLVTSSPAAHRLTPIDYKTSPHSGYRKQADLKPDPMATNNNHWNAVMLASRVGAEMYTRTAAVDIGYINGKASVVEINPLQLGSTGLFACDVRALVGAVLRSEGFI